MANPILGVNSPLTQVSDTIQPSAVAVTKPAVKFSLTVNHPVSVKISAAMDFGDGTGFHAATLLWPTPGSLVGPGTPEVVVDLRATLAAAGKAIQDHAEVSVRVRVETYNDPSEFTELTVGPIAVSLAPPALTSLTATDAYVGAAGVFHLKTVTTGSSKYYRASTNPALVDYGGAAQGTLAGAGTDEGSYGFGSMSSQPDGDYTISVVVYDQYYNRSEARTASTYLLRTPPVPSVTIVGTLGHGDYTGIAIDVDGHFTPNRAVTLNLAAKSAKPVQFRIRLTSNCNRLVTIDDIQYNLLDEALVALDGTTATPTVNLITSTADNVSHDPATDDYGVSQLVTVTVEFRDAAGNTVYQSASIVLNTTVHQTDHAPLRPADASYQPILKEVSAGGTSESLVLQTVPLPEDPIRAWPDTFYPTTHGYPLTADGDLDTSRAIGEVGSEPKSGYDPVVSAGVVQYDEDQRPVTLKWTGDGTKNYGNMASSSVGSLVYWVIDNTGYGDFQLEFEHFNLNPNVYGPPYNPLAPHSGDVLAVFDASQPGALVLEQDDNGKPVWRLQSDVNPANSVLFAELAAYMGTGPNVMDLVSGRRMNSSQTGGFKSDWLRGVSRLVLVLYTDALGTASGFKLKAGRRHDRVWANYHVDEQRGELWVHQWKGADQVNGLTGTGEKRFIYDYLDADVTINHDTGEVEFAAAPAEEVRADYTYFTSDTPPVTLFAAAHDDLVAYQDAAVYVLPAGVSAITAEHRTKVYETDGYGRLTTHYSWDKDRGILAIDAGQVPVGRRLVADYYHHTFVLIAHDGYGDLTFTDPVIVADQTPVYPDFTFVDVKVVNEGDALLEDWRVKFVPRGYDTDNNVQTGIGGAGTAVDQVLDLNRPWDVQQGTAQETYEKMAVFVAENYLWPPTCTRDDAKQILLDHKDQMVTFDLEPRSTAFGRVVWVLGGTSGDLYPTTTAGPKRTSLEVEGKYYTTEA